MNRLFLIMAALLLFLPSSSIASGSRPAEKPSAPLTISITTSGEIEPGVVLELTVEAAVMTDADEMIVDVKLPGKVELVSGELSWRGPVKSGDVISLTFSVRVPERGKGQVRARVLIDPPGPTRFSASDSLQLGPDKVKATPLPIPKRDGRGREIIEYRP